MPVQEQTGSNSHDTKPRPVTHQVRLQPVPAAQLVPILRPLLPQAAHLAALPDQNALLIVDRFGNVKRVVALVRELDKPSVRKEEADKT